MHGEQQGLMSNKGKIKLKANTAYKISFDTKGYRVGGNGAYYFLKLRSGQENIMTIGEWYDRLDAQVDNKNLPFTTPGNSKDLTIVFGIKNEGGYYVDNISLIELPNGHIVDGEDVGFDNNVRPFTPNKGLGYEEGFEDGVLADSLFSFGFNRWGHFTNKPNEVINGKLSFTSELDEVTYQFQDKNNYYEFMYSNDKYLKLSGNSTYRLTLKYKLMTEIRLHSDPSLKGYAYIFARSKATHVDGNPDNPLLVGTEIHFASASTLETVYTETFELMTPSCDDTMIIIGLYGIGTMIVDDILVEKV